jgi:hypothetical protein
MRSSMVAGYFINSIDAGQSTVFTPVMSIFALKRWVEHTLDAKTEPAPAPEHVQVAKCVLATLQPHGMGGRCEFEFIHGRWEQLVRLLRGRTCVSLRDHYRLPPSETEEVDEAWRRQSEQHQTSGNKKPALKPAQRWLWAIEHPRERAAVYAAHERTRYETSEKELKARKKIEKMPKFDLEEDSPPTVFVCRSNAFALDVAVLQPPCKSVAQYSAAAASSVPIWSSASGSGAAAAKSAGSAGSAGAGSAGSAGRLPLSFVGVQLKWSTPTPQFSGDQKKQKTRTDAELITAFKKWQILSDDVHKTYSKCCAL